MVRDLSRVMDALGPQEQVLDNWARQVQGAINSLVSQGGPAARRVKNWLNGVWLKHPLHPALTDATIGAWSTGLLLDLLGADEAADAALTVGVLAAVPTALSGAADWVDAADEPRRLGLVHATLNTGGLVLMLGSLVARRNERRGLGIALSTAGFSIASISAWVGGELVYRHGTSVSRLAFEPPVEDFQVVARADALQDGKLTAAEATVAGNRISVALLKRGPTILAISGTCTHWGGPLAEGKLVDGDCIECPWHASQFDLRSGAVLQGPASMPVTVYETRIRNGNVEVRRRG